MNEPAAFPKSTWTPAHDDSVPGPLSPLMNDAKWKELRAAMLQFDPSPQWRTLVTNGYQSLPDGDWFAHFSCGGYNEIVHIDILVDDSDQRDAVRQALRHIHLPGEETKAGFRVYGYAGPGQFVGYI